MQVCLTNLHLSNMKNKILILLFTFSAIYCNGQREAANWYFGNKAAITFNTHPVSVLNDNKYISPVGSVTMSDFDGNLLFYSNGQTVWNKNHQVMKNGAGLKTHFASNFNVLSIPYPGNKYKFYIFTLKAVSSTNITSELYYSVIDISNENGNGEVIVKNVLLIDSLDGTMAAVRHSNSKSIWLILHDATKTVYYSYLIENTGINKTPVETNIGNVVSPNARVLNASPNGKKIIHISYTNNPMSNTIQLYDFNNNSGKLSDIIVFPTVRSKYYFDCEFSPNCSKLYLSVQDNNVPSNINPYSIIQYDLNAGSKNAIINSEKTIAQPKNGLIQLKAEGMQVGMDWKLYISLRNYEYLGVINYPDSAGLSCFYNNQGLKINPGICTSGLPNFLQSYFFIPDFEAIGTCFGDSTEFYLTDTSGVDSVFWDFNDATSGIHNSSKLWKPKHLFSDTGLFNISAIVYHQGVADTTKREIRISLYPTADFTFLSDSIQCINQNMFSFKSNSSALTGDYTLYWDFGDDSFAFNDTVFHNYIFADTFLVSLTALSDYGCENTLSKQVVVYEPSTDFSINDSIQCFNVNNFLFEADTLNQEQKTTYFWDVAGQDTGSSTTLAYSFSNHGRYDITHIAQYQDGCLDTAVKSVYVAPMPLANFSINDSNQCLNWNKFIFNNNSSIDTGSLSYFWQFSDSAFSNLKNPSYRYKVEDHYLIRLIVSSDKLCNDTLQKQVVAYPSPHAEFSVNNDKQCLNENSFSFTNKSGVSCGKLYWLWEFGDGKTDSVQHPRTSYQINGAYTVNLIANTEYNCSDTFQKNIIVDPSPVAGLFINDSTQCQVNNRFMFFSSSAVNPGTITKYYWDFGNGDTSNLKSIFYTYPTADTFILKHIVMSNQECYDTILKTVIVGAMPVSKILVNDTAQCFNQQHFEFRDSSTVIGDSIVGNEWIIGNDTIRNSPSEIRNNFQASTFNLQLTTYTSQGCAHTATRQIIVHPSPEAAFSINDTTQCLDSNDFEFTNLSVISDGVISNQWTIDTFNFSTFQPSNLQFDEWGQYPVQLITNSDHNCADTSNGNIYVYPMPVAAFVYLNNCLEDTMWFFDSSMVDSGSINQWYWDFKNGYNSTYPNPWTIYYDTGQKSVTLVSTSDFGCSSDTTQFFKIESKVSSLFLKEPQWLMMNTF
jgi:PKD repeat protein